MCIIKWNHHLSAKRHRDSFEDVDLVHSVKVVARSPLRITTLINTTTKLHQRVVAKYLFWRKSIKNGNFEETHLTPRYSLDNRGKPVGDVEKTFHRPRNLHKDSKTPAQVHINTFAKKNFHLDSCSGNFFEETENRQLCHFLEDLVQIWYEGRNPGSSFQEVPLAASQGLVGAPARSRALKHTKLLDFPGLWKFLAEAFFQFSTSGVRAPLVEVKTITVSSKTLLSFPSSL